MNSMEIVITSRGAGMQMALEKTEQIGRDSGLSPKEMLHLRLLAEELFGMVRGVVGEVKAWYRIDHLGKHFAFHLQSNIALNQGTWNQLLALSTSGTNSAAVGFMGRLREMITLMLLPPDDGLQARAPEMMNLGRPAASRVNSDRYDWSLKTYRVGVESTLGRDEYARKAKDELEKSIVANIADDVSVGIEGSYVEITIMKDFGR